MASGQLVHPTAIIDEPRGAIGDHTVIWHWAHVAAGAQIGARCVLGQGCFVAGSVQLGDGCRIQNHVSLYDGVILDADVFVGPSAVFTNVKHPRAHVSRKDAFQPTRVGPGATIGANATVVCGVTIGAYAMIGAGAVVTRDVPAHAIVIGAPARPLGWACRCGETLRVSDTLAPEAGLGAGEDDAILGCPRCDERYQQHGELLERIVDDAPTAEADV